MKAGRLPGLCFCGQCRLMTTLDSAEDKPYWSGAGFRLGLKRGLTVSPGIMVFGLVVGAAAERQGLSGIENIAMNLFVCSGIAQLVALEAWPSHLERSHSPRIDRRCARRAHGADGSLAAAVVR
jgi:hypothetical protein